MRSSVYKTVNSALFTDVYCFAEDPSGRLYASAGHFYYSDDSGATWTRNTTAPQSRITALRQPGEIFLSGSAVAKIWRSSDNGVTWIAADDGLPQNAINALAVAPDGTVYAGTSASGVYRSTYSVPVELSDFQLE